MSMRYKGGVISATPPTTSGLIAVGVWTLEQQLQAKASGAWPALPVYWIATIGNTGSDVAYGIGVDSNGNSYITGIASNSPYAYMLIAKYNTSGALQWQRVLGNATNTQNGRAATVDSSGNVYVTGYTDSGSNKVLVAKYNTNGTIQWQGTLGTGAQTLAGRGIFVDSSGNVYVCADGNDTSGSSDLFVFKYNNSGTLQWQRKLGGGSAEYAKGVTVDASGNVYAVGYSTAAIIGFEDIIVVKYDSSGTIQWQRAFGGSSNENGYAIAVDSSSNVYVAGDTNTFHDPGGSGLNALLVKYDTSGTLQWQKALGIASGNLTTYGVALDLSGNIYVGGAGGTSNRIFAVKYNNAGTLQWQRQLYTSSTNDFCFACAVDIASNLYIGARTSGAGAGSNDGVTIRLPGDGSKTGTYGPWTYAASSFTDGTPTLTSSTSALTAATSTITSSISTLTEAAGSLTSSTTTI